MLSLVPFCACHFNSIPNSSQKASRSISFSCVTGRFKVKERSTRYICFWKQAKYACFECHSVVTKCSGQCHGHDIIFRSEYFSTTVPIVYKAIGSQLLMKQGYHDMGERGESSQLKVGEIDRCSSRTFGFMPSHRQNCSKRKSLNSSFRHFFCASKSAIFSFSGIPLQFHSHLLHEK